MKRWAIRFNQISGPISPGAAAVAFTQALVIFSHIDTDGDRDAYLLPCHLGHDLLCRLDLRARDDDAVVNRETNHACSL
jgi:hypothetical protein